AVGYYGTSSDALFTESSPPGDDFLAHVCVAWEATADRAAQYGARVTKIRNGLVLGLDGGALPKLLPPFMLGLGGIVADGRQWYSWIHLDDAVGIFQRACLTTTQGALNATAPIPVRNSDFTRELGQAIHRPTVFKIPEFALNFALGEGSVVATQGQRVLPEATLQTGYRFRYESIEAAFAEIFR
ncbi:MAG TPA: TIGR01777 family oxidoreductase, partial [Candidatus Baltobacteraceae bacterium]|nr:TIGR01777 family oxidoreductase [Candidatus Baltobacteraceae bacterium]